MEFNASNTVLWNIVIQLGIIAVTVLFSTLLRRKIAFVRQAMLPTAVLAGFVLLILRSVGLLELDGDFLEMTTYHGIAVGFIAMSLRVPAGNREKGGGLDGVKSGALIVSTYLVQALLGLLISAGLAFTVMPGLFKAAGILLPLGYGQGAGQANNVGMTYEALGFVGGRSFGLSLAAAGYLCACVVGVIYINILRRRGRVCAAGEETSNAVTVDDFENRGEIPVSESIDRFSMQVMLVGLVYLLTYLVSLGIDSLIAAAAPGLTATVSPLLWGFNFIIGSALAMLVRVVLGALRRRNIMTRQYQNNYLLSRISGVAFDLMTIAGIASINIEDLSGLWVPFLLMAVSGGIVTLVYLQWTCRRIYPGYYYEGLVSMYGMLTGTISSGVLLLREIDDTFATPAANNLVLGSSFAILFGAPMLILIGLAPDSDAMLLLVFALCAVYLAALLLFMFRFGGRGKKKPRGERA